MRTRACVSLITLLTLCGIHFVLPHYLPNDIPDQVSCMDTLRKGDSGFSKYTFDVKANKFVGASASGEGFGDFETKVKDEMPRAKIEQVHLAKGYNNTQMLVQWSYGVDTNYKDTDYPDQIVVWSKDKAMLERIGRKEMEEMGKVRKGLENSNHKIRFVDAVISWINLGAIKSWINYMAYDDKYKQDVEMDASESLGEFSVELRGHSGSHSFHIAF